MALRSYVWYLKQMIKRADPWNNRSAISRWAHVVERIGLALAGGSCGLFVAADAARVDVGLFSSPLTVLAIMLYGAAGFYLGIDLPPAPPDHRLPLPLTRNLGSRADAVELLSAAGTFRCGGSRCVGLRHCSGRDRARKYRSPDHSCLGDRHHHANCRRH